ncbi:hypothetical protein CRYUN_Cryun23aG0032100 [Craigia yunnanensis]
MVVADKILNRKGVIAILRGIWLEEVVTCLRELRVNRYCLSFNSEVLMQRALDDRPWSVMKGCLILQRWGEGLTIEELDFTKVVFWAQIHNLPLEMMTRNNAEKIGGKIGRLLEVEDPMKIRGGEDVSLE